MGKMKELYKFLVLKDGSIIGDIDEEIAKKAIDRIKKGNELLRIGNKEFKIKTYSFPDVAGKLYLIRKSDSPLKKETLYFYLTDLLLKDYMHKKEDFKKKFELLNKAGEFFSEVSDIESIIKRIIKEVKKILNVEIVSVFKVDEKNKKISFYEFTKGGKILRTIEIEWGKGIVGHVAIHKKPLIVNDVTKDRRFYPGIDKKTGFKTKNILAYPLIVQKKIIGVIEAINKKNGEFNRNDLEIVSLISSSAAIGLQNAFLYKELEDLFKGTITSLASAVEAKDPYTSGHVNRVTDLSIELAKRRGMSEEDLKNVELAAILHDIGKIAIPDSILKKPDRLTDEEYEIIKTHVYHGARILTPIPGMKGVIPAVLHHHERWDGKGYPMGLRGSDIPLIARIITITDSFDAMNSDRPYRKRIPSDVIRKELVENAGKQFDPELIDIFLEIEEVKELLNK